MDDFDFDFGFTAMDADELEVVQKAKETENVNGDLENRLNQLYGSIQGLLNHLKMNPEKDYIYWPGRVPKIEEFENRIKTIAGR